MLSFNLCLCLPSGPFPLGFPIKTLYAALLSPKRATCTAYFMLLDFMTQRIFGEEYRNLQTGLEHLLKFIIYVKVSSYIWCMILDYVYFDHHNYVINVYHITVFP